MDSSIDKKLNGFRQISQEKLQNIFCSIPGSHKDIIIEPNLIKPLEFVCGASWLKNKGIDKIYKFDKVNPPPRRHQFIYLITADLILFKHVLDQISGYESRDPSDETGIKAYHLIVFPTILHCFEVLLEQEGLFGVVELHRFSWDFISLDGGVLSLEYQPKLFRDIFLRGDTSLLGPVAHSFRLYNMVMKRPQIVLSYGEQSDAILNMCHRIENARNAPFRDESKDNPDFTAMIVVDRDKDYASTLLTSVVYASLLLELFQYKSGYVTIDVENNKIVREKLKFLQISKNNSSSGSKKDVATLRMHSGSDNIYRENRYRHFADVVSLLSSQAKNLGVESKTYKEMKINEMKEFVSNKLPQVAAQKKELFKHLIACEAIVQELGATFERHQSIEESMLLNENRKQVISYIEEQISTDAHKFNTIRLMCLLHITCGVTPDEASKFITNYCNAFGHQYLTVFTKLSTARLFPELGITNKTNILSNISIPLKQTPFQVDANKLKLFPVQSKDSPITSTPTKSPGIPLKKDNTCPSYVFNGNYIPLVAQLAQILLKASSFEEISLKLGHVDTQIKVSGKAFGGDSMKTLKETAMAVKRGELTGPSFPLRPKTIFIFVVGGVTYAEIAACNLVERFTGAKIVLASDSIISGNDLIETAFN
ncbi:vacuolar protein sorting-associated protein 33B [Culicoides brevitarsis]|uniref:vacuolar protein sorting-associated protein 33B n=1 Tax=Culicoides brevitarsis TaxID=469753 RepID=UPI00307B1547